MEKGGKKGQYLLWQLPIFPVGKTPASKLHPTRWQK